MRPICPLLLFALAGCASAPALIQAPPPPKPLPLLAPPPPADWRDAAETGGGWRYSREPGGSAAQFGAGGVALFTIRCETATRRVRLLRSAAGAGAMTVTTSYTARALPLAEGAATLAAGDPLLDQLAFSRGRFEVEAPGTERLILPAWAEPARVIEDCRG